MSESTWSRRDFLEFFGKSISAAAALTLLPSCATKPVVDTKLPFRPLGPSFEDAVRLTDGLTHQVLIKWADPISKTEKFGFNNDYIAYIPLIDSKPNEGLMWVNHEYIDPVFTSGYKKGGPRTRRQVDTERKEVGGSILHIKKTDAGWTVVKDSQFNKRFDATTPIPLICERPIAGSTLAVGTLANCAGGVTPWKTVLTCEENYHNYYGEAYFKNGQRTVKDSDDDGNFFWNKFYQLPPEHYGWVVEVDLKTAQAKKLTALGRFAHECATCVVAADGRTVVYSGDDAIDEHLYKFISAKPGSLEKGELYVADTVNGRWLPLVREKDERLKQAFVDQTEVLIRTREAAKIVGATPLDRPEDVEVDAKTKAVYVALTNNKKRDNWQGSILKIEEAGANPLSLEFNASTFLAGGEKYGFACPDNLAFDKKGNLWMTCDMPGQTERKPPFDKFGNNSLFFIPMSGIYAGHPMRVASAPVNAEFTGPCFSPDGKTLFLSVQHPGEKTSDVNKPLSHWPLGGKQMPRPSVIAISGPAMDALLA